MYKYIVNSSATTKKKVFDWYAKSKESEII